MYILETLIHSEFTLNINKKTEDLQTHNYKLIRSDKLPVEKHITNFFETQITFNSRKLHDKLPNNIKTLQSTKKFKKQLKILLQEKC